MYIACVFSDIDIWSCKPQTSHVKKLLEVKSAEWHDIGSHLGVDLNYRDGLRLNSALDTEGKLEKVIGKWLQDNNSVTWKDVKKVLVRELHYNFLVQDLEKLLKDPAIINKYI